MMPYINEAEFNLAINAFNLVGTNTISRSAEIMSLATMTAQETEALVTFNGTAAAEANEVIDTQAADHVPSVINCRTAAEVIAYFDKLDEILTDANGRYHVKWLVSAADYACHALVSHLGDVDKLPANLAETVRAYEKNA